MDANEDGTLDPITSVSNSGWWLFALTGVFSGLAFYGFVAVFALKMVIGPRLAGDGPLPWACRVMSDPVNALTFAAFGAAVAMLAFRASRCAAEKAAFTADLIEEDFDRVLIPDDARDLRKKTAALPDNVKRSALVRILRSGLNRSKANWNPSDVAGAVDAEADVLFGEIDSEYAVVRYLAWAIPSIGFIGTVLGIGNAMGTIGVSSDPEATGTGIEAAAAYLNTAFDTTFVSLVLSLVLMYFVYTVQAREERIILAASDWCSQRFVNRMHVEGSR